MVPNNKDFTIHPYDTDAIEFPEESMRHVDEDTTGSIESYLQYRKNMELNDKHPALQDAWERYSVLLKLFREESNE